MMQTRRCVNTRFALPFSIFIFIHIIYYSIIYTTTMAPCAIASARPTLGASLAARKATPSLRAAVAAGSRRVALPSRSIQVLVANWFLTVLLTGWITGACVAPPWSFP